MGESTVVELHISPPCYGAALLPHCIASHKLLALSDQHFDVVTETSRKVIVPSLTVMGDNAAGEPALSEITGDTAADAFDQVVNYLRDCGATAPITETDRLPGKRKAQSTAYRLLLEAKLIPPVEWVRQNTHRALHQKEMAKHVGTFSQFFNKPRPVHSRHDVKNEKDAIESASEGFGVLDTMLRASSTAWLLSTTAPSLLDILSWAMLVCCRSQPVLRQYLEQNDRLIDFMARMERYSVRSHLVLRPLRDIEADPDTYAPGRVPSMMLMGTFLGAYAVNHSPFMRNFANWAGALFSRCWRAFAARGRNVLALA
eukprot:TRINITY_DN1856_c0_g1_i1.p1 TRINITY_DN1856_c0_g1~~TRINITY_DN1856_c0_g1_i1.p1  ORF type:complete len:333 (+),score=100.04 TRINITY_DN1856_c0_g1_i1:59-1000(+)